MGFYLDIIFYMKKATIKDIFELRGKRVFLRADLNVPLTENGEIADATRITESLYTIRFCLDRGARVILASHLGRPDGQFNPKFSLKPVYNYLKKTLKDHKVFFAEDCIGAEVKSQAAELNDGELLLLENLRFHKEEEANDEKFAKELASLADVFVNDAFGAAHRAHASTATIAKFLPAVSGFLMEKELKILGEAITTPKKPLTLILGGKKVADKIGVIENLLNLADNILIGGGMAFTFIKAQGGEIGSSIVDESKLEYCRDVLLKAKTTGTKILLPVDAVVADKIADDAKTQTVSADKIPSGLIGLDIGPKTIEAFKKIIKVSGTIIMNGPVGVFENELFANGTREIVNSVADSGAISIACGGDSAFAVVKFGAGEKFTHISTGGGASLEFIEGKKLPGVETLMNEKGAINL
jgi:phosphoglycerate kinase